MKINHIAVVVNDMAEGHNFWHGVMGLPAGKAYREEDQGVDVAVYPACEKDSPIPAIEIVSPLDDESGVARYLAKKGPGMHHLCFEVDDIVATLAELKEKGVQLIDEEPRLNAKGVKVAFVHPKSTGGVLVEFYEIQVDAETKIEEDPLSS